MRSIGRQKLRATYPTAWVIGLLWLFAASAWAGSGGFDVRQARLLRQADAYIIDADIDYQLPPAVQEALANNVPITLVVELKVQRTRRLQWDETVLDEKLRYRLRYHALSKRYQVQLLSAGNPRSLPTLEAAVHALGSIREFNIAAADRFMLGVLYKARLRAYLDFEALPLPLRAVAYLNPQWHLDSPWYRWSFEKP